LAGHAPAAIDLNQPGSYLNWNVFKFWMAAWRGRRTMTWITGVVAFLASIVECFTGHLSQQLRLAVDIHQW
jgi:hypothetical protein